MTNATLAREGRYVEAAETAQPTAPETAQLDLFADCALLSPDVRARAVVDAAEAAQRRADTAAAARVVSGAGERLHGVEWAAHSHLQRVACEMHHCASPAVPGNLYAGAVTRAVRLAVQAEFGNRRASHLLTVLAAIAEQFGTRQLTAATVTRRGITDLAEQAGLNRRNTSTRVNRLAEAGWLTLGRRRRHVGEHVIECRRPISPGPKWLAAVAGAEATTAAVRGSSTTAAVRGSGIRVPSSDLPRSAGEIGQAGRSESDGLPLCEGCKTRPVTRAPGGDPNPRCKACWQALDGEAKRALLTPDTAPAGLVGELVRDAARAQARNRELEGTVAALEQELEAERAVTDSASFPMADEHEYAQAWREHAADSQAEAQPCEWSARISENANMTGHSPPPPPPPPTAIATAGRCRARRRGAVVTRRIVQLLDVPAAAHFARAAMAADQRGDHDAAGLLAMSARRAAGRDRNGRPMKGTRPL